MSAAKLLHTKTSKIWWNLPKLVTNTLVNFDNFFSNIILSPSFCNAFKKCCSGGMGNSCLSRGYWSKHGGEFCLGTWVKLSRFNFLTHKCICSSLNTINLKLFGNHGGIYRFRRKFKKDSGEIKPLGVHRNMIIGNWQYVCLLFCWSWPKGWDNFQKREDSRKWGDWFWNSGYRHLCTLVLVPKLIPFFGSP